MSILYFFKLGHFWLFVVIFLALLLVDIISFLALKKLLKNNSKNAKIVRYVFWTVSIIIYLLLTWAFFIHSWSRDLPDFSRIYYLSNYISIIYVSKLVLILFYLFQLIVTIILRLLTLKNQKILNSLLFLRSGIVLSVLTFIILLYSYLFGRFNYQVIKEPLYFKELPASFNNLKIVQISDIHLGIYYKHSKELSEVINLINQQSPDIVFFTGDAVNNFSEELVPFIPILKQINAKIGKYAILGNHDYGDYYMWKNDSLRNDDNKKLVNYIDSSGFILLRNQNLTIHENGDSIIIAGTENLSPLPFRQVGNLNKTLAGTTNENFILMLTHNPEYWRTQFAVISSIKATFSGHTHGMQLSISKNWSPLNFRKRDIAGLYEIDGRYLYVNRGLGGGLFAGRIGMWPEITVFTLKNK